MRNWIPDDLALASDASDARWVEERLWPGRPGDFQAGSLVPDVFEAYARVLHPAWREGDSSWVRWADLAAERGVTLTTESSFFDVSGVHPFGDTGDLDGPEDELPDHLLIALAWFSVRGPAARRPVRSAFGRVTGASTADECSRVAAPRPRRRPTRKQSVKP